MRYLYLVAIYLVCICAMIATDLVLHWHGYKVIFVCIVCVMIAIMSTYKLYPRK